VSEYQLYDLSQSLWDNALSMVAIIITVMSGYLIVAYAAGSKLKTNQIGIINFIYIGTTIFLLLGCLGFCINAAEAEKLAFAMSTQRKVPPTGYFSYALACFIAIAHLASLWFMWNIRRDKSG
jgi:hypothetical protein